MKNNIEGNDQSIDINDWDIFIKIKEQILFIILLRGYKKQILSNTVYLIVAFVMLTFISNLIIPKEALITFLIVMRLIQVWVVYILKDFKRKERTEVDMALMKKSPLYLSVFIVIVVTSIYSIYSLFNSILNIDTSWPYGPLTWDAENYWPATFFEATDYCQDFWNGWRVPTKDELDYAVKGHYIPFKSTHAYWSSTQDENNDYKHSIYVTNDDFGWANCDSGAKSCYENWKDFPMYVHCVKNR